MIFEFELKPIEEIIPWGEPPKQSLHWFGLTDGKYRIKAGDEQLLNYSGEYTKYCVEQFPEYSFDTTFVEYQVVRLWEDILDLLPDILNCDSPDTQHFLDAGYLVNQPDIWFCADSENVTLNWDNTSKRIENIPVWSATSGNHRMSKVDLVRAVQIFDASLIAEMSERVDTVCRSSEKFQGIIDFEKLKTEHKERAHWLELRLNKTTFGR